MYRLTATLLDGTTIDQRSTIPYRFVSLYEIAWTDSHGSHREQRYSLHRTAPRAQKPTLTIIPLTIEEV